ncbi:cuticle protein CP14.6-like [Pollicipes pollicipes]|uniref:cuticle protein CP14.6-like n=1 Tax=Pollicipes pollicipes TaxID=41117 RepID=UPI00188572CC|nr:cuticle protein CP14.6-like [Pollicipes pollicipes]
MKLVLLAVVVAVAAAAPDRSYEAPKVFETENGIYASESGRPVEGYGDEESYDVNGEFSYTGPYGVVYKVVYVADANGFQPQGDHLPTPVPTEYPTPEVSDDDDDEERYEVRVGYGPSYN